MKPHTRTSEAKRSRNRLFGVGVYLDNAAATPTDSRVIRAMNEAYKKYGNPSSFNTMGRETRQDIESSRLTVARFVGARPDEIVFTGSGSEANNLALLGLLRGRKGRVLTTPIEHPSVLEPLKSLRDIKVEYLKIDQKGIVDLESLEKSLAPDCLLIPIMYANNEIGTIEPIREISKIIKTHNLPAYRTGRQSSTRNKILLHVDTCQAAGHLNMSVNHLGADLLTFNGSKIYGPRGIGVLYVRRGVELKPLIYGGSQEKGLRAGTENAAAIIGLAKAISFPKFTVYRWQSLEIMRLRK